MPITASITNMGYAVTAAVGAALALTGFDIGGLITYLNYNKQITQPVNQISMQMTTVLAALAGIFLAANLRSSAPTIGDPFTLKIVAACALGGTSLAGGKGSELGTILGVFTVAIIENGMNFIGVNAYYQNIVFGIFVLAAIALTVDRSIRGQIVK